MSWFISHKKKKKMVVDANGQKIMTERMYYGLFVGYTRYKGDKSRNSMHTGIGYLDEEFTPVQKAALLAIIDDMVHKHTFPCSSDPKVNARAEKFYRDYLSKFNETERKKIEEETEDEKLKKLHDDDEKRKKFEEDIALKVSSLRVFDSRSVGADMLALHMVKQLGLQKYLEEYCDFDPFDAKVAIVQIACRAIYPYSELRTAEVLQTESSLCELMGIDQSKMTKDRLYRMALRLDELHDEIELYLRNKVSYSLFTQGDEKLIILDCTNTFFEGRMANSDICRRGRSKEKRDDCKIVGLAFVVNAYGIVVRSKIIRGNIQDVKVLKSVIEDLKFSNDGVRRIVVIDCGFASVSNLKFLVENGYDYVTVMRAGNSNAYEPLGEAIMQETDNGKQSIKLQKVAIKYKTPREIRWESLEIDGETRLINMNSREVTSMQRKFRTYAERLDKYQNGIQGTGTKQKDKLMKKLFKLEHDNADIHKCFDISVSYNDDDIATSLTYVFNEQMAHDMIISKAKKFTPEEAEAYEEANEILEDNVLLVDSYAKELKEKSMFDLEMERFERGLKGMAETIGKSKQLTEKKFDQSYGALRERHPHAAKCYDVEYQFDEEGHLKSLKYEVNEEEKAKACSKHGKYLLRTSIDDLDEKTIWMYYNVIRSVEESFKVCKSDLKLRPNFHKSDEGIKAHINLAILAYWIVSVTNYRLREEGYRIRWERLTAAAKGLQRVTVFGKTPIKERNVQVRLNEECPEYMRPVFECLGINYKRNMKMKFCMEPVDSQNCHDPLFERDTSP